MSIIIALLTFFLVLNCLFLMLLVLIQLPKKEAGIGVAFGGGATDALFGAGSGTALTKLTKYSATIFLIFSLVLSILNSRQAKSGHQGLEEQLRRKAAGALPGTAVQPNTQTPAVKLPATPPASNTLLLPKTIPVPTATNPPQKPAARAPSAARTTTPSNAQPAAPRGK